MAAWALGFVCQHGEALKEALSLGAVEVLVALLELPAGAAAGEALLLKQAQHAAFALRVVLEGGGREAVRRCDAVDGCGEREQGLRARVRSI